MGTMVPPEGGACRGPLFSPRHLLGRPLLGLLPLLRMDTFPSPLSLALRRAEGRGHRLLPCAPPRPRAPRDSGRDLDSDEDRICHTCAQALPALRRLCQLSEAPGSDSPGQEGGRGLSPRSQLLCHFPSHPMRCGSPPPSAHGVPSGHRGHTCDGEGHAFPPTVRLEATPCGLRPVHGKVGPGPCQAPAGQGGHQPGL